MRILVNTMRVISRSMCRVVLSRVVVWVFVLVATQRVWAVERPNLLFIFTDDQSHRTISCYPEAYSWVDTPNIDALARAGVRFSRAYIGTWCMPSRATMLTGHHQFGVQSMRMAGTYPASTYDPAQCPFWPSVLRKQGYTTAHIGKWHTGIDTGFGRDWDHQIVWNRPGRPENAGNYYDDQIVDVDGRPERVQGYTTDWYTDRADAFIRGANRKEDQPWYLWLCFGAVHGPFTPAARHQQAYENARARVPEDIFIGTRAGKPAYVRERDRWVADADGVPLLRSGVQQRTVKNAPLHGNSLHDWIRQYHQSVLAIDEAVGRLRDTLQQTGQTNNTVIVFAADQGLAWGQHGFQQKVAPYDSNIRGPLIICDPRSPSSGTVCPSPVGGTDLPPTFLALAGVELPWKMHGHDLSPLIEDPGRPWPHAVLTVMTGESYGADTNEVPRDPAVLNKVAGVPWWVSLVQGDYKYIRTLVEGELEELYDLKNDPDELHNLALEPRHQTRLLAMRERTIEELRQDDAGMATNLPEVARLPTVKAMP